ncbi:MAG: hypothetical protein RIE86_09075 [Imperialibacter sp.]|uniref:hypothetical protein n=1 Tax=Imperialibacter sp. TaxID=2038411 RepID=UPI0032EDE0BA
MRFGLDIEKQLRHLLPISKRKAFDIAWLKALVSRLTKVHGVFVAKVAVWDGDLFYAPGHTIQIERLLTDRYLPGITIRNNQLIAFPFVSYEDDNGANLFTRGDDDEPSVFSAGDGAYDPTGTSFTILIPAASIIEEADRVPFFTYEDDNAANLFTDGDDTAEVLFDFGDNNYLTGFAELVYNPERITADVNRFKPFNKTFDIEIV